MIRTCYRALTLIGQDDLDLVQRSYPRNDSESLSRKLSDGLSLIDPASLPRMVSELPSLISSEALPRIASESLPLCVPELPSLRLPESLSRIDSEELSLIDSESLVFFIAGSGYVIN